MNIQIKQVSSLDKVRNLSEAKNIITKKTVLKGEAFSFQQVICSDRQAEIRVRTESELKDNIKIYQVKETAMDLAAYPEIEGEYYMESDDDYITKEPGLMPDILVPLQDQGGFIKILKGFIVIWIEVKVPYDFKKGEYKIDICYDGEWTSYPDEKINEVKTFLVEVLDAELPEQDLAVTQWFHTDCIADVHNKKIYSDEHWDLIEKYMKEAKNTGINMILTPVITPPLDTKIGKVRPNTQLVKITKEKEEYSFDFSLLKKFIDLAKKCGMKYFEISHLFSQWGLKYSPNIYVTENGEEKRLFGWHVRANDQAYKAFLQKFLPALVEFLKEEEVFENCYFHISDEPTLEHIEAYRYASDLVKPLLCGAKIMDALSSVDFYDTGLVSIPVTASDHIEPFLERKADNQWVYYCCAQAENVANRFMAMPSRRSRILGTQLYKYDIKGFLQWGFNFYYSQLSLFEINPYVTTSAEKAFPSGDPFIVYPGKEGPYPSVRSKVFKEAIQDVSVFKLLESFAGKEYVVKFIEDIAKMEITFSSYPRTDEFLLKLDEKVKAEIKKYL